MDHITPRQKTKSLLHQIQLQIAALPALLFDKISSVSLILIHASNSVQHPKPNTGLRADMVFGFDAQVTTKIPLRVFTSGPEPDRFSINKMQARI